MDSAPQGHDFNIQRGNWAVRDSGRQREGEYAFPFFYPPAQKTTAYVRG
jgi:hypothetical protein